MAAELGQMKSSFPSGAICRGVWPNNGFIITCNSRLNEPFGFDHNALPAFEPIFSNTWTPTEMLYTMRAFVEGGCQKNGQPGAIGAAAAFFHFGKFDDNDWQYYTRELPDSPAPTNQRAEITAIILALQIALDQCKSPGSNPHMDVTIHSDSRYAINCMTVWVHKWVRKGWIKSAGAAVCNRDLIQEAFDLNNLLRQQGYVRYVWIPRGQNTEADDLCNRAMDEMEEERRRRHEFG